jgi:tight adherence protein B
MSMIQLLLIAMGLMSFMVLGYLAFAGPSAAKESARRLQAVRYRHSESTTDKVEAQLKKAVAARKPKMHHIAGSESRIAALALRLHRTGKPWTLSQYFYASGGLALAVSLLIFLKSGSAPLALGIGLLVGAGLPHMVVNFFIKRRGGAFTTKFPDAIELLVRGLRSGLPVTETLGVIATEIPGPVGEEFKLVNERIKIGKTMEDALQDTADRLNTPEFSFFVHHPGDPARNRRQPGRNAVEPGRRAAQACTDEAQDPGDELGIQSLGLHRRRLPFIVFTMIYWINPTYLGGFFTDDRLIVTGLGGLTWMSIGAFIMAKMVSFEI